MINNRNMTINQLQSLVRLMYRPFLTFGAINIPLDLMPSWRRTWAAVELIVNPAITSCDLMYYISQYAVVSLHVLINDMFDIGNVHTDNNNKLHILS